jgi:DNA-binding MurR/RpiR family transcriptional regulator
MTPEHPMTAAADSYDALRAEISARHDGLSRQLQKIARFALSHPNEMALETVAAIAAMAEVQPSSLIRFAKAFRFDGFSEMQRVFRSRLVDRVPSYSERIKGLTGGTGATDVLTHFVDAGIHALQHLRDEMRPESLERAIELLAQANTIHVVGQRRSYPVAAYLAYALGHLGRRAHLVDNVGGMAFQQAAWIADGDALIAVSFRPYAQETVEIAKESRNRGVPVITITDGPLSPLASLAAVTFEIEDAEVRSFRSLTATMCLAVTLVVGLGQRLARIRDADRIAAGA